MKKFKYSLQRILSLKTTLKKQAQKELAKVESEKNKQLTILYNLQDEVARRLRLGKDARTQKLNVARLERSQTYLSQLSFLIIHQTRIISEIEKAVEDKRNKLVEASREEKKYQRLKEIRRDEYTHEMELVMQKDMDEFAKNTFLRKCELAG